MAKLQYRMLNQYEKDIYMKMHNANIEENSTRKYMEQAYSKAAHPRGIIFPAGMMFNLFKGFYYQVKDLAQTLSVGTGRGEQRWYERADFFIDMMNKYNCNSIDWATFPPPPHYLFHDLIEGYIELRGFKK